MMELTINGQVYQFNFGMGFLREANKIKNEKSPDKNYGLRYIISGIIDGDPETLVDALDIANKGQEPRITKSVLDSYIDNPDTDIEALFEETLDFLGKANATKKLVKNMMEAFAKLKDLNQELLSK